MKRTATRIAVARRIDDNLAQVRGGDGEPAADPATGPDPDDAYSGDKSGGKWKGQNVGGSW